MFTILRAVLDRLKTLLVADAALDLESRFVTRRTERKGELLRKAEQYAEEGLDGLAAELRERAERLSTDRPLATALPVLGDLAEADVDPPRLPAPRPETAKNNGTPRTRKKTVARGKR